MEQEPIEERMARERAALIADVVARASLPEGAEVDQTTLQARLVETVTARALGLGERLEPIAARLALSIIERLGDTFDAGEDAERAVVALGHVEIQGARLVAMWRMRIEPVLELARVFQRRQEVQPFRAPTMLARGMLTPERDAAGPIDRRPGIVEGVALCIAKGLDDCEVLHDLVIDPVALFEVMAKEELARVAAEDGAVVAAFTGWEDQWLAFFRRHGVATDKLAPGTGAIPFHEVDEAADLAVREAPTLYRESGPEAAGVVGLEPFIGPVCRRCKARLLPGTGLPTVSALCDSCAHTAREAWTKSVGERPPNEPADTPRTRAALDMLHVGADGLADAEAREGRGSFTIGVDPGAADGDRTAGISFDPEEHLNHARICPQCASLLRYDNQAWRCDNGHEITEAQMQALLGRETQPAIEPPK